MGNPVEDACSASQEGKGWSMFSGPMFIIIIFAVVMIVMNFLKDRKEKKSFEDMKNGLSEGKIVRLRDDTVGMVLSINQAYGTLTIDSAGTKLEKSLDSVLTVFPDRAEKIC